MTYKIWKEDGLYCVYRWEHEHYWWRIVAAYEALEDAKGKVNDLRNRKNCGIIPKRGDSNGKENPYK